MKKKSRSIQKLSIHSISHWKYRKLSTYHFINKNTRVSLSLFIARAILAFGQYYFAVVAFCTALFQILYEIVTFTVVSRLDD